MGGTTRRNDEKLQDLLKFNLYRLLLLSIFLLLFYSLGSHYLGAERNLVSTFTLYVVLSYLLTIIVVFMVTSNRIPPNLIIHFQFVMDIFLTSYLVYYTGAAYSPFSFLYLLIALSVSFFFPSWTNIFYGIFSGIIFTLITYLYYARLSLPVSPPALMKIFYIFSAILIFNILGSYLYSRIGKMEEKLKTQEKNLTEIKELHKLIVNNVRSGILITNEDGTIIYANPSAIKILGFNPTGKKFSEVFPTEIDRNLNRKEIEMELNGKNIILGLSATEMSSEEVKGCLILFQDLTQIKEYEKQLMEKEKLAMIGEMASNIAHELRNPLSTIRASSELLIEELQDINGEKNKLKKLTDILITESDRIEHLVKQILNYSKVLVLNKEPIELRDLIQEQFQRVAQTGNSHITLSIRGSARIKGDALWLGEAFLNIFQNAFEALGETGEITVTITRDQDNNVKIIIKDSGEGIPEELKDKIFQPFFTTKRRGTGLGLALTKKIFNAHGGDIRWDSTIKAFVITLPGDR